MSKILLLTNHSYMLYRFRKDLIRELMKEHEVVLGMPFVGHEEDFQAMGLRCVEITVDRRGINAMKDLKLFCTYWSMLRREKPDLVITYSIKPNIYAGIACSVLGIPYCTNMQGLGTAFQRKGIAQFVTVLYRTALKRSRTVFFENGGSAQELVNRKIVDPAKVVVLPGAGINLEEYSLAPYPQNDAVRFLYMGRIMREKGVEELFAAMRRLHEELGDKVVLDLVGFYEDDYEAEVNQLVASGTAVFHGFKTDPRPYYAAADCVVLPSYHEGMSNVLLEAAAIGRPVITSDIPGCREAVEEGNTGLLVQVRDWRSLYDAMNTMARLPAEKREEMGRQGRQRMHQIFDKEKVVAQTVEAVRFDKKSTVSARKEY